MTSSSGRLLPLFGSRGNCSSLGPSVEEAFMPASKTAPAQSLTGNGKTNRRNHVGTSLAPHLRRDQAKSTPKRPVVVAMTVNDMR